jgi:hypothetical protein
MTPRQKRIKRLRVRIARLDKLIDLLATCDSSRRQILCGVVDRARNSTDLVDLVDEVADHLDDLIEPDSPVLEWISDAGIQVAAQLAVALWYNRHTRLEARRDRLVRKLLREEKRA